MRPGLLLQDGLRLMKNHFKSTRGGTGGEELPATTEEYVTQILQALREVQLADREIQGQKTLVALMDRVATGRPNTLGRTLRMNLSTPGNERPALLPPCPGGPQPPGHPPPAHLQATSTAAIYIPDIQQPGSPTQGILLRDWYTQTEVLTPEDEEDTGTEPRSQHHTERDFQDHEDRGHPEEQVSDRADLKPQGKAKAIMRLRSSRALALDAQRPQIQPWWMLERMARRSKGKGKGKDKASWKSRGKSKGQSKA